MCNEIITLFAGDAASRGSQLFRLSSPFPFHQADTLLERGNESGHAVSQRVINYPDSFGVARALLSIKVALGRGNFLRGAACYSTAIAIRSRELFCSPRSAVCKKELNRTKGDCPIIASANGLSS